MYPSYKVSTNHPFISLRYLSVLLLHTLCANSSPSLDSNEHQAGLVSFDDDSFEPHGKVDIIKMVTQLFSMQIFFIICHDIFTKQVHKHITVVSKFLYFKNYCTKKEGLIALGHHASGVKLEAPWCMLFAYNTVLCCTSQDGMLLSRKQKIEVGSSLKISRKTSECL